MCCFIRLFITTCACVQATCKAGTCSSLLYYQTAAFVFLNGGRSTVSPTVSNVQLHHQVLLCPFNYLLCASNCYHLQTYLVWTHRCSSPSAHKSETQFQFLCHWNIVLDWNDAPHETTWRQYNNFVINNTVVLTKSVHVAGWYLHVGSVSSLPGLPADCWRAPDLMTEIDDICT